MIKIEIFEKIETLMPILQQFQTTGSAHISIENKLLLKEVYQAVHGQITMDLSCGSCQLHYLTVLASYYEREHPKWLVTQEPVIDEPPVDEPSSEAVEPASAKRVYKKRK